VRQNDRHNWFRYPKYWGEPLKEGLVDSAEHDPTAALIGQEKAQGLKPNPVWACTARLKVVP